ncbi:HNH endonuclease [Arthrobacter sp. NPDC056886]|uniref:HNH endonuclease n=1 Tax=Arthrobacter sp. NPDC056886 TaxID=3345960 RepID=UPI00366FB573
MRAKVDAFSLQSSWDANLWSHADYEDLKKEVKTHYIIEQGYKCAYCDRMNVTTNHSQWDVDHIISRGSSPRFLFEPTNLAVSCRDCNITKSDKEVLRRPGRKTLPRNSSDYIIVHPHYDEYGEHIGWIDFICYPKFGSIKGQKTIEVCGLLRYARMQLGVDSLVVDDKFMKAISALTRKTPRREAVAVMNYLLEYLYPDEENSVVS